MSTQVMIVSVVCIMAGVVLLLFEKGDAMATILITAGTGGLTMAAAAAKGHAKESEKRADAQEKRADAAVSETQTIRKMLRRD